MTEKPSVKFGEALREQVEERLRFFETGEPPSKNAEAIRKVLEAIALEEDGSDEDQEVEMRVDDSPRKDAAGFSILPLIEDSPPAEAPKKKSKKRKGDDMDVDPEEEEEVPRKKVKLSKEEKRALKKELKQKRKEEEKATGVRSFSSPPRDPLILTFPRSRRNPQRRRRRKGGRRRKRKRRRMEPARRKSRRRKRRKRPRNRLHDIQVFLAPIFSISVFACGLAMCILLSCMYGYLPSWSLHR